MQQQLACHTQIQDFASERPEFELLFASHHPGRRQICHPLTSLLLDADRTDLLEVGHAHHDFLHAVHLQGPHTTADSSNEKIGNAGALLNQPLDGVISHQQFMQTQPPLVLQKSGH